MSPPGVSSPLEYAPFQSESTSPPVSVWPPSVCSFARWWYIWCPDSAADAFAAKFRLDGAPGSVASSRNCRRSRDSATGFGREDDCAAVLLVAARFAVRFGAAFLDAAAVLRAFFIGLRAARAAG